MSQLVSCSERAGREPGEVRKWYFDMSDVSLGSETSLADVHDLPLPKALSPEALFLDTAPSYSLIAFRLGLFLLPVSHHEVSSLFGLLYGLSTLSRD
jgi:hypothetical protein